MLILRHPILSHSYSQKILACKNVEALDQLLISFLKEEEISTALELSNPSFYKRLSSRLKTQKSLDDYRSPLIRYIDRMSTRTSPYQALSAVSFQNHKQSGSGKDFIVKRKKTARLYHHYESDSAARFALNPSLWIDGKHLYLYSFSKANEQKKYKKEVIEANLLTCLIISSLSAKALTRHQAIQHIQNKAKLNPEASEAALQNMIEQEILIPAPNFVPCVNGQETNASAHFNGDLLESEDAPEEQCQREPYEELYVQRFSSKQSAVSINHEKLETVKEAFKKLGALYQKSIKNLWLDEFIKNFAKQFPSQEAPLLEAISKISLEQKETERDFKIHSELCSFLENMVDRNGGSANQNVELEENDLKRLEDLKNKFQIKASPSLSYTALAVSDQEKGLWVKAIGAISANRFFAPYAFYNEKLKEEVAQRWEREKELCANSILAELTSFESSKVSDLIPRISFADYHIPFNATSPLPKEKQIGLERLKLKLIEDELVLYCEDLGKQVIPISTNKLRIDRQHPVIRLLLAIGSQKQIQGLTWDWENILSRPSLPRLSYQGMLLSPRKWKIHSSFIKRHLGKSGLYQVLKKHFNIEKEVFLLENDKTTRLNFDSLASKILLEKICSTDQSLVFMETIGIERDDSFIKEYMIPIEGSKPDLVKDSNPEALPEAMPVRKECAASFHILLDSFWYNFALKNVLPKIIEELRRDYPIQNWFFIKYTYEGSEIRLRLFGDLLDSQGAIHRFIQDSFEKMAPNIVKKVNIVPYGGNLETYGSTLGNKLYEKFSTIDSHTAIGIYKNVEFLNCFSEGGDKGFLPLEMEFVWFLISTHAYLEDFSCVLSEQRKIGILNNREDFWRKDPEQTKYKAYHAYFKAHHKRIYNALFENSLDSEPVFSELREHIKKRSCKNKEIIQELLAAQKDGLLGVSLEHFIFRLIHMSKVRISVEFGPRLEALAMSLLAKLYKDRSYRETIALEKAFQEKTKKKMKLGGDRVA